MSWSETIVTPKMLTLKLSLLSVRDRAADLQLSHPAAVILGVL